MRIIEQEAANMKVTADLDDFKVRHIEDSDEDLSDIDDFEGLDYVENQLYQHAWKATREGNPDPSLSHPDEYVIRLAQT
jgi:hypothetical protein